MPLAVFKEDCEIVKEASKEGTPEKDAEETPSVVDVSDESAEEPSSLNSQFAAFKTEVAEAMSEQIKELVESVHEVVGALEGRLTGLEQKMPDVAAGADTLSLNLADEFSAAADVRDSGALSEVEPVATVTRSASPRADVRTNASPRSRAYRGIEAPPAGASIPTNFGCSSDA